MIGRQRPPSRIAPLRDSGALEGLHGPVVAGLAFRADVGGVEEQSFVAAVRSDVVRDGRDPGDAPVGAGAAQRLAAQLVEPEALPASGLVEFSIRGRGFGPPIVAPSAHREPQNDNAPTVGRGGQEADAAWAARAIRDSTVSCSFPRRGVKMFRSPVTSPPCC